MAYLNKIMLIGNVGRNPEVRTFQDGNKIANTTMATTKRYTDNSGNLVDQTTWHSIQFRGKNATIVEQLVHYGDLLYVEGELISRKYTDRSGQERVIHEVQAYSFQILKQNQQGGSQQVSQQQQMPAPQYAPYIQQQMPTQQYAPNTQQASQQQYATSITQQQAPISDDLPF